MTIATARDCMTEEGSPKRVFANRGQAFAAAQRMSLDSLVGRLVEYECRECGQWHVGHAKKGKRVMVPEKATAKDYGVSFYTMAGEDRRVSIETGREDGGTQEVPFLQWARSEDGVLSLILDQRFGLDLPGLDEAKQAEIITFLANAIAVGGGYPSIHYLDRKMAFR